MHPYLGEMNGHGRALPWQQAWASIMEMTLVDTSAIWRPGPLPPPHMVEDTSNISIMICVQKLLRGGLGQGGGEDWLT